MTYEKWRKMHPPPPLPHFQLNLKKFSDTSLWPYGFLIWRSKAHGAWGRGVERAFRFFTFPTPSPRELTFRLVRSPTRFLLQNFTSLIQKAMWTCWKVGNAIILNFDIVKSARNNSPYKWYLSSQSLEIKVYQNNVTRDESSLKAQRV